MKNKLLVTLTLLLGFLLLPITNAYAIRTTYTTKRLAGDTRFGTAVEISKEFVAKTWRPVDSVVLCTAYDYADSVSVTPFATYINAPILLTGSADLNSETKDRIVAMAVKKVYIIGGAGAVSDNVSSELTSMGLQVERIGGVNRFATNKAIIAKIPVSNLGKTSKIINGYDPYLGFSLSLDTLDIISTKTNIIVNPIVIYDGVSGYYEAVATLDRKSIDFYYQDYEYNANNTLLSGKSNGNNITTTAVNNSIQKFFYNYIKSPRSQNSAIITTSNDYADVMCAGPLSAITYTPIVYFSPTDNKLNQFNASCYNLYKDTSNIYYLGGTSVVKDGSENLLNGKDIPN